MVTIKDIARESGYSISTVSRVLNHRNDVSPDAKKKIEEVVEKFHFVPNNNAKHLKQSNTKTIVVLVKGISNMLFSNIVEEIQQMIGRTDYTLVVSYIDEDENEVEQALQLCREQTPAASQKRSAPVLHRKLSCFPAVHSHALGIQAHSLAVLRAEAFLFRAACSLARSAVRPDAA